MYSRHLTSFLHESLADRPVVLLNGARQVGKSTLVQTLADGSPRRYLTLDDATVLTAATRDPAGFIAGLGGPVTLDEVQRAPEMFLAIKAAVDQDRVPGRFLLTGSANVLVLPRLSDSLAGRMEILSLWPLSQGEVEGVREGFVDALFAKTPGAPALSSFSRVSRPAPSSATSRCWRLRSSFSPSRPGPAICPSAWSNRRKCC